MDLGLRDRVALVTGASKGIGRAVALALRSDRHIRMARAVFPIMQAQGGGRIVNIIGAAARNPTSTYLTGGAANAALVNFTKGLADLGAKSNILVTAVSPAATRTERWSRSS